MSTVQTQVPSDVQTIKLTGKRLTGEIKVYPRTIWFQIHYSQKKIRTWSVKSVDQAKAYFEEQDAFAVRDEERKAQWRKERAEQRRIDLEKMKAAIVPGVLLHGSWGYEQTQCELYEVISVAGTKVTLRPVDFKREGRGWASEARFPLKGQYIGEPITLRISSGGVKYSDYCTLTPSDWNRGYYCSWYY